MKKKRSVIFHHFDIVHRETGERRASMQYGENPEYAAFQIRRLYKHLDFENEYDLVHIPEPGEEAAENTK